MDLQSKVLPDLSRYRISPDGLVFDILLNKAINQQTNSDGYKVITLRLDCGKRKTCRIHQLVAKAFIENPQNKPTVNHIDGIKTNNMVGNLEWATRSEQVQHAWDTGLIKDLVARRNGIRKLQGKPVICITTGEIFNSLGEAAEVKGLKKSNISKVCRSFKTAGISKEGVRLEWRFYDELQTTS